MTWIPRLPVPSLMTLSRTSPAHRVGRDVAGDLRDRRGEQRLVGAGELELRGHRASALT